MTDFGPLLANPRTLFLGAAAQFGIFATLLGALVLTEVGVFDFTIAEAAAIGIIGGADGPTAIYVAGQLAPQLLGAIAVAAYSYMALVPLIQPPIIRALTTEAERKIEMVQLREVSQREKILFPLMLLLLVWFACLSYFLWFVDFLLDCLLESFAIVVLYPWRYDPQTGARLAFLHRLHELYQHTSCNG